MTAVRANDGLQEVHVHRRKPTEERRTYATPPPDGALILDGDVRLIDADTGATVAIQAVPRSLPWATDLTRSLRTIKWEGDTTQGSEFRLSGFKNAHRTFGFSAPVPLRRRYGCSVCAFNGDYPRLTRRLAEFARTAEALFAERAPAEHAHHLETTADIDPTWRFGGTPWTSGIINRTSALPYHRDAGNLKGSWSAMLGLRKDVNGGLLHLAEFDVYLTIPDRSVTIFDGQGVLHAVTPFRSLNPAAYRYTIVVYAKRAIVDCLDGANEIRRAQRLRSDAEERIAEQIKTGEPRSLGGRFIPRYSEPLLPPAPEIADA